MSTKMSVVCRIMLFLLMISGCNKQSYQSQTAATNQPQPIQTVQAAAPEALEKTEPHENNNVQSSSQSADLDEHSPAENGLVEVRKVPKCPSGSQEHTWKTSKGKIGYRCHVG